MHPPPRSTLFPYTTLFRSAADTTIGPLNNEPVAAKMDAHVGDAVQRGARVAAGGGRADGHPMPLYWQATILEDRKSTRLNSSHMSISYAVFCLKKKKKKCD